MYSRNITQNEATIMKRTVASLTVFFALGLGSALAQLPPPPTPTAPPTQVPIDGGVLLLAAAGAAYGAKKIYARNKKQDS